jgi:hypothetical protein
LTVCTGIPTWVAVAAGSFLFESFEKKIFNFPRFGNPWARVAVGNGHGAKTCIFGWTFRWPIDREVRVSIPGSQSGWSSSQRSSIAEFPADGKMGYCNALLISVGGSHAAPNLALFSQRNYSRRTPEKRLFPLKASIAHTTIQSATNTV